MTEINDVRQRARPDIADIPTAVNAINEIVQQSNRLGTAVVLGLERIEKIAMDLGTFEAKLDQEIGSMKQMIVTTDQNVGKVSAEVSQIGTLIPRLDTTVGRIETGIGGMRTDYDG